MKKNKRGNVVFLESYKKKKEDFNVNDEVYINEIVNQVIMEQEEHTEELIKDILSKNKNK